MMTSRYSTFATFFWLTVGYAVIHICVIWSAGGYIASILQRDAYHETLQLDDDGEPYIQGWGFHREMTHRRLDGTMVENTRLRTVNPLWFFPAENREPSSWTYRVQSFADFQHPATNWYLIAAADHPGTAYFEGFDRLSHRHAGYLGINGFTSLMPTAKQRFPVRTTATRAFYDIVTLVADDHVYRPPVEPSEDVPRQNPQQNSSGRTPGHGWFENATVDQMWLLSAGTIYEIQLGTRTVRPLLKDRPDLISLDQVTVEHDGRDRLQVVAQSSEGLVFIDPKTGDTESLNIQILPNDSLYQLRNGQRIWMRSPRPVSAGHHTLTWLNSTGDTIRKEEVQLNSSPPQRTLMIMMSSAGGPSPIVSTLAVIANAWALNGIQETSDLGSAAWNSVDQMKVWLISSWVVAILCGWACRQRELTVFQSQSWFWPITVGFCGWFGWMGYLCVRPLPPRLPKRQFFPPVPDPVRPLGTEIFA